MSSSQRPKSMISPSRPPESPTEILYNTAVQSFVRRDHLKTHATLSRLISSLKKRSRSESRRKWYDFGPPQTAVEITELDEWLIKSLKLYISAVASLYSDPPSDPDTSLHKLIPPTPPSNVIHQIHRTALECYNSGIVPPPVISTLLLASLKLRPSESALSASHRIAEDWLAGLPDSFFQTISRDPRTVTVDVAERKRVEGAREGYLKVIELFTGEVLAREGEWEMARGILDGESILGSKRKEVLYRHLRALQTRRDNPNRIPSSSSSSASDSGILPSPSSSGILPTPDPSPSTKGKSRSDSQSTSSSERTARPNSIFGISKRDSGISNVYNHNNKAKGKGRAAAAAAAAAAVDNTMSTTDSDGTIEIPKHIELNHPNNPTPASRSRIEGIINTSLALLPASLRDRLISLSVPQVLGLAIPLPLIAAVLLFVSLRRRLRRRQNVVVGVAAVGAQQAVELVRERLRMVRERNGWEWVVWWFKWWLEKFRGIWRLGTTITYF